MTGTAVQEKTKSTLVPSRMLTFPKPTPLVSGFAAEAQEPDVAPDERFILFGKEWLGIQAFVATVFRLPITEGDWQEKYGTGLGEEDVTNALGAMKEMHDLAPRFGNPTLLKERILTHPDYVQGAEPPPEIYPHIVWLANRIENTAGTFASTFAHLEQLLSPEAGDEKKRAENLRTILVGKGGLQSSADHMKLKTQALLKKLLDFDRDFEGPRANFKEYTGEESALKDNVDNLCQELHDEVAQLRRAKKKAYEEWVALTVGASVDAGLVFLSGGLLLPCDIALAPLGVAAGEARKHYNNLVKRLRSAKADDKKKTQLQLDLEGFNGIVDKMSPDVKAFAGHLSDIEGVWFDISNTLAFIAENYTDEELSQYSWVNQAFGILAAQDKWHEISKSASQFTQHSLVSFSTKEFGETIPEPKAA